MPKTKRTPKKTPVKTARRRTRENVDRLDGKRAYRLTRWIDVNRDEIVSKQLNAKEVATLATAALGFQVKDSHARGASSNVDVPLFKGRRSKAPADAVEAFHVTARIFRGLFEALGVEPPPELRQLAAIKAPEPPAC